MILQRERENYSASSETTGFILQQTVKQYYYYQQFSVNGLRFAQNAQLIPPLKVSHICCIFYAI